MHISKYSMTRRVLISKAQFAITDAMDRVSKEHGDLTVTEWVDVLLTAAARWNKYALKDEWEAGE